MRMLCGRPSDRNRNREPKKAAKYITVRALSTFLKSPKARCSVVSYPFALNIILQHISVFRTMSPFQHLGFQFKSMSLEIQVILFENVEQCLAYGKVC